MNKTKKILAVIVVVEYVIIIQMMAAHALGISFTGKEAIGEGLAILSMIALGIELISKIKK